MPPLRLGPKRYEISDTDPRSAAIRLLSASALRPASPEDRPLADSELAAVIGGKGSRGPSVSEIVITQMLGRYEVIDRPKNRCGDEDRYKADCNRPD
jgi:hypothetical protein